MKKSRIIIPALAVMALSMGAAVTSTVAWFTANRNASAQSSTISIINPEGALKITAQKGIGTTLGDPATSDNNTPVKITHAENFRDGSVDITKHDTPDEQVYTSNLNIDGELDDVAPYRALAVGTNFVDKGAHAAENYTLKFDFGKANETEAKLYGLFFNAAASNVSADASGAEDINAVRGLRIGFADETNKKYAVYAPSVHSGVTTSSSFVTSTTDTKTFTDAKIKVLNRGAAKVTSYADNKGTAENLLGHFDYVTNQTAKSISLKVWVWFEGTDLNNVVSTATLPTGLTLNLAFNVVTYTGA